MARGFQGINIPQLQYPVFRESEETPPLEVAGEAIGTGLQKAIPLYFESRMKQSEAERQWQQALALEEKKRQRGLELAERQSQLRRDEEAAKQPPYHYATDPSGATLRVFLGAKQVGEQAIEPKPEGITTIQDPFGGKVYQYRGTEKVGEVPITPRKQQGREPVYSFKDNPNGTRSIYRDGELVRTEEIGERAATSLSLRRQDILDQASIMRNTIGRVNTLKKGAYTGWYDNMLAKVREQVGFIPGAGLWEAFGNIPLVKLSKREQDFRVAVGDLSRQVTALAGVARGGGLTKLANQITEAYRPDLWDREDKFNASMREISILADEIIKQTSSRPRSGGQVSPAPAITPSQKKQTFRSSGGTEWEFAD